MVEAVLLIFVARIHKTDTNTTVERISYALCAATGFALLQVTTFAWDGAGHMVIAAEAFRQLAPECEKTLSDTNADPELRAAQLSFLIHLIGDMHQPLHCASFFGPGYPKGDRGGNDFYVKLGERGVR
jgi:hypothetical protein